MFKGIVNRLVYEDMQTLGKFHLYDGLKEVFQCAVLELPNRQNKRSISNVIAGKYKVTKRWSKKYDWHFIIEDVEGRDFILIHFGNYYTDTRGCLLFGKEFHDINRDGYKDITSSRDTMRKFMDLAPSEFILQINDL